ncbi:hypothetical protein PUN28_000987 [Cardiocondyla obscurior]|uniref:Uncharacterized protein n=1 Tax=Cardiocondyla obscurior TaxID=286306 RepID=A0AAW2H2S8_9HYME
MTTALPRRSSPVTAAEAFIAPRQRIPKDEAKTITRLPARENLKVSDYFRELKSWGYFALGNGILAESVKGQSNVMGHFLYSRNPRAGKAGFTYCSETPSLTSIPTATLNRDSNPRLRKVRKQQLDAACTKSREYIRREESVGRKPR